MLEIRKQDLIGKGAHRECYRHPDNERLCIKVIANGNHRSVEIKREKNTTGIWKSRTFLGI